MGAGPPSVRPSLLLVDDDPAITSVLGPFLQRNGFHVTTAQDGDEGLRRAGDEQPDVVVADVAMPGMDGREMLRRLRERAPGLR